MDELQGGRRKARTMLSEKWRSESYLNCDNNLLSHAIRVILQTGRGQAFRFLSRLGDRSAIGVLRDINQGNQCRAYDDAARFHFVEVPGRGKGCR